MALRLKSLKTRTALAIASVVVVTLVINAVYLILKKRSELRGDIDRDSQRFAELTKERLAAIQGLETRVLPSRDTMGDPGFEIVAPYFKEWGVHKLSFLYEVSYKALTPKIAGIIFATGALTLLSILASALVAAALASR